MKTMRIALLVITALLLAACSGTAPDENANHGSATQTPGGPAANAGEPPANADNEAPGGAGEPSGSGTGPLVMGEQVHPWGTDVQIGPIQVAVLNVKADAWSELASVGGIAPPEAGHQYVVARLRVTNSGADRDVQPGFDLSVGYATPDGTFYGAPMELLEEPCWNVPDGLSVEANKNLAVGSSNDFNVCLHVPDKAVPGGFIDVSWMVLGELDMAYFEGVR